MSLLIVCFNCHHFRSEKVGLLLICAAVVVTASVAVLLLRRRDSPLIFLVCGRMFFCACFSKWFCSVSMPGDLAGCDQAQRPRRR